MPIQSLIGAGVFVATTIAPAVTAAGPSSICARAGLALLRVGALHVLHAAAGVDLHAAAARPPRPGRRDTSADGTAPGCGKRRHGPARGRAIVIRVELADAVKPARWAASSSLSSTSASSPGAGTAAVEPREVALDPLVPRRSARSGRCRRRGSRTLSATPRRRAAARPR